MSASESTATAPLAGRRLLVVEDRAVIAAKLARVLDQAGATVMGPIATLAGALNAVAADGSIDAAIIDVDLRGELAFPLCERLAGRGTRFMLITGYELAMLPPPWSASKALCKPFTSADLVAATLALLASPAPAPVGPTQGGPFHPNGRRWGEAVRNGRNIIMESRMLIEEARARDGRPPGAG